MERMGRGLGLNKTWKGFCADCMGSFDLLGGLLLKLYSHLEKLYLVYAFHENTVL